MSGLVHVWRGKGFSLRDGRVCQGFKVAAKSREEALKLLNRAAGWVLFKDPEQLGAGAAQDVRRGVWMKWGGTGYEHCSLAKARGRLPDAEPTAATTRVQRSVRKLLDSGGHRSTVRFGKDAWIDLNMLMEQSGMKQCEVLEDLIRERAARLRSGGSA